jgi:hypothetical protein
LPPENHSAYAKLTEWGGVGWLVRNFDGSRPTSRLALIIGAIALSALAACAKTPSCSVLLPPNDRTESGDCAGPDELAG